jgi:hypothetical protein
LKEGGRGRGREGGREGGREEEWQAESEEGKERMAFDLNFQEVVEQCDIFCNAGYTGKRRNGCE